MSPAHIRIATRASPLALWQASYMAARISELPSAPSVELIHVRTSGDGNQSSALREFGSTGVFTREVERLVLNGKADIAVHSLKDLPTDVVSGLCLACIPERAPRCDALILPHGHDSISSLAQLSDAAIVGTGSPRRQAQIRHQRPDLSMAEIRGNVETRIAKLDDGAYDAIVLAEAGLRRLDLTDRISLSLGPPEILPAVGQGALGVECRSDDEAVRELLSAVTDKATLHAVTAERSLLRTLRAGCHAPLGAWTDIKEERLTLIGVLLSIDGKTRLEATATGECHDAEQIGKDVAQQLIEAGGTTRPEVP
ncbi:MAG: hydroxymethylbilane synthase [Fuerstiella sp.]|nr:hydroxymethylbilane synthase [Fuerstiella sp.]